MKKEIVLNILVVIGVVLFNILFWNEGMGVNTILFTLLMASGIYYQDASLFRMRNMQFIALGTLFFSIMVVVNHSLYAKILFSISSILMIGIAQSRSIRFLGYGLIIGILNMVSSPVTGVRLAAKQSIGNVRLGGLWRKLRLFIVPAFIGFGFFVIYSVANIDFALLFLNRIIDLFSLIFRLDFSFERIIFSFLGLMIVGGAWWKNNQNLTFYEGNEIIQKNKNRGKYKGAVFIPNFISLKNEYMIAMITMVMLIILISILNILDVKNIWFKDVSGMRSTELKAMVHQGTYVLIFSIIMAMAVVVYFFRGNINYFPKNNTLRILTCIWIIQNAILAISVVVRNVKYIQEYGVAYKRIGVFIFLILTFIGLFTMLIKVKHKKSLQFLFEKNAWAWYVVFLLTSTINWDVRITQYNILSDYNEFLDVDFIVNEVSDKNIYVLEQYSDDIESRGNWSPSTLEDGIVAKKYKFKKKIENQSWLSWNFPDHNTAQGL